MVILKTKNPHKSPLDHLLIPLSLSEVFKAPSFQPLDHLSLPLYSTPLTKNQRDANLPI